MIKVTSLFIFSHLSLSDSNVNYYIALILNMKPAANINIDQMKYIHLIGHYDGNFSVQQWG